MLLGGQSREEQGEMFFGQNPKMLSSEVVIVEVLLHFG